MTDDYIPLQGFTTQFTGLAADFAEGGLHVALVVGRQHHGVTFALVAPTRVPSLAAAVPYMRCRGSARPRTSPARPAPAPPPLEPGQAEPPPRPAPHPAPLRGTGTGWGGLAGFESGLGPGITSAQAG